MKYRLIAFLYMIALLMGSFPICAIASDSPATLPQVMANDEAKSIAYLQRAYFALEQAQYYADKSKKERVLPSFDYEKLKKDLTIVISDLELYLYPRRDKVRADAQPFKIEGDFFLDDIIKNAK